MATENVQRAPSAYPLGGLNRRQIERLFEQIACAADVLANFASNAAAQPQSNRNDSLHVAAHLAERIGAMAELAVPGTARGDLAGWTLSPTFENLAEVRHG